jgi:hypothetical protein
MRPSGTGTVAVEIPAVRQFRYMMANDGTVPVDPATSQTIAELTA